ncbi:acetyl-CoA hydrolase/transferase C-terminal domain-containing protein [Pseudoxanthomonas sp.]|uniref:acetyl-CoA hydrolase/transferase C-terminal domain-containing protein n=1 Tax=Pseudoxanthomonas sp. TaxID=1871049 RepID=UPI0026385A46|nr:acetyl-CoA hydrolase/transferase C-terminal domain-containing protein [Pseudoxanthomonas sp.]WDS37542.1 MAG: acetyl-CoA hydrolase/transferase C-terminal domain-containing protein [Pseudoxanthomonas sp.]
MRETLHDLDEAIDLILRCIPGALRVAAPLGIGKPHRLLNALYDRVEHDPARPLQLYTALSLDPPAPKGDGLEARFFKPFAARHFGRDFPALRYVQALKGNRLPPHIQVEEFYMQSGALLHSAQMQRSYVSLNYTHAADGVAQRAPNVIVQKVARDPQAAPGAPVRFSLSCNNDTTQDTLDAIARRGLPRPLLVAEVDPHLPWMGGTATVAEDFFDLVIDPPPAYPALFGLPRQPVSDADYAIGLYASALVRDGGTLQIGIGTLADALSHALVLRHTDNATYRRVLHALDPELVHHPAVIESGGMAPFSIGLYGCSEMLNEGFRLLVQQGVIKRRVLDDLPLMQRIADGSASEADQARLQDEGEYLHGAFYLGSPEFYDWLRNLDHDQRRAIGMRRISEINQLYGGNEALERLQRVGSRFFNSCMMATALGAAVSDGLEDGRIVSGVGGQHDFVSMAHALDDARSVLMLRSWRGTPAQAASNIRWNYGHTTIPRHLRDVFVDEYGIADLRAQTDEDCVIAMCGITDARFSNALLTQAKAAGKLRADFNAPAEWQRNTPEQLAATLAPFRRDGTLPDYPLGSDFTDTERQLVTALSWLKEHTATPGGKLRTVAGAVFSRTPDAAIALTRMDLSQPRGPGQFLMARLLRLALAKTQEP